MSKDFIIVKKDIESAIYGLAVGDALGVPYEFLPREKMMKNPCTDMVGFGAHDKPAGTWSDDTSLTLALADALATWNGNYNVIMKNFGDWLDHQKFSVDGVFDVGMSCMDSIHRYYSGTRTIECGGTGEYDNGNGSLMRILPAVFYSIAKNGEIDEKFIYNISALTHGHIISKTACVIYAKIVKLILDKNITCESVSLAVEESDKYGLSVFDRLKNPKFSQLPINDIKSSGYVVYTLEAAIWCFFNTTSYKECVLAAVNLGGDTDTVAAVVGGLAGLHYGKDNIPESWIEKLREKTMLDNIIDKFFTAVSCPDKLMK